MKFLNLAGCAVTISVLAACGGGSDSAWKAEQRAKLSNSVFPNAADRQGVFLAFPLESGGVYKSLNVVWFTDEVSRGEIASRVSAFCKRQDPSFKRVGVKNDMGASTRTLHTGETKSTYSVWYTCMA